MADIEGEKAHVSHSSSELEPAMIVTPTLFQDSRADDFGVVVAVRVR